MPDLFLEAIENLSRFHRDHEKFHAQRPREQAVALQGHSRALSALADRWEHVDAQRVEALTRYEGADDLNAPEALQLDGILFMEGEGEPAEITSIMSSSSITPPTCSATPPGSSTTTNDAGAPSTSG